VTFFLGQGEKKKKPGVCLRESLLHINCNETESWEKETADKTGIHREDGGDGVHQKVKDRLICLCREG